MNQQGLTSLVSGRFRLTVGRLDGASRTTPWFDNLILDQGLNKLGETWTGATNNAANSRISVGTGSTAPVAANTGLETSVASTTTVQSTSLSNTASSPYYSQSVIKMRFGVGVAAGNLSEVGIGWGATTGVNLFARALILNEAGAPTTITVLSDEYLDVEYSFRVYPPIGDYSGSKTISGSNYDYVMRATFVTSTSWWSASTLLGSPWASGGIPSGRSWNGTSSTIAAITALPTGVNLHPENTNDGSGVSAYVNNSYERQFQLTWGLTKGNYNHNDIGAVVQSVCGASFQIGYTPRFTKGDTRILTLDFKLAWARRP